MSDIMELIELNQDRIKSRLNNQNTKWTIIDTYCSNTIIY